MLSSNDAYATLDSPPTPLPELEAVTMRSYTVPLSAAPLGLDEPEPARSVLSLFAQAMTLLAASIELVHLGLSMSPLG